MTIDCREAVRRMWAYLERALERPEADEGSGRVEFDSPLELARHLRALVAESERHEPMPPELRARIELLLAGGPSADPGAGGGR